MGLANDSATVVWVERQMHDLCDEGLISLRPPESKAKCDKHLKDLPKPNLSKQMIATAVGMIVKRYRPKAGEQFQVRLYRLIEARIP